MAEFVSRGPLRRQRWGMTVGAEAERQDLMYHGNGPVPRFSLPVTAAAWIDTTCMLSPRSCDIFRRKAERERGCILVVVRRSSEHLLTDFGVIVGLTRTEMAPGTHHVACSHDLHADAISSESFAV